MIIPDLNLLVYAHVDSFPQHAKAREWWERVASADGLVAMPWPVLTGFLRVVTNRRAFREPLSVAQATAITDEWMELPGVKLIEPGPKHYAILCSLIRGTGGGNIISDAHLAALAIEYNAELHSNDTDFGRFAGLKWVNPLR